MNRAIDGPFHDAAGRLDAIRAQLALVGSVNVRKDPRAEAALASQKASVYVWLAACVEEFVRQFLTHLLRDISANRVSCGSLRVELLAVANGSHFERLQTLRHLRKWRDRVAVLRQVIDPGEVVLSEGHLPLDGRTIEPEHLEIVWLVFGLPRQPFPGPLQRIALLDIARGRNQVAHGEIRPEDLGRSKTIRDLERLVGFMEDVVQHLYMCGTEYLDANGFRR